MTDRGASSSPGHNSKGGAEVFAKRVQRQFSRAQEKVLQKLGKSTGTRDEHFEQCVQNLYDQQSDGHRIYKDLKAYLNAVKVMRDASGRLFQSLYDAYEMEWDGAEDLGAIVEGEDLLWKDYEVKLLDQAMRTMESYMCQFPDARERVAKRGRKLVDYDSSRHHLEVLQNAKKRDDLRLAKANEEMVDARSVFESINTELKEELPTLYDSRIGCYVTVFQAISNLSDTFYKEMTVLNQDLQTVMRDLQAQHPDKVFVVKGFNRTGSMKRRSLMSPKSWMNSFSEFHTAYSPRSTLRREHGSGPHPDRPSYDPDGSEPQSSPSPGSRRSLSSAEAGEGEVSSSHNPSVVEEGTPPVAEQESGSAATGEADGEKAEHVEKESEEGEREGEKDEENAALKEVSSPEAEGEASTLQQGLNHSESTELKTSGEQEVVLPDPEGTLSSRASTEDPAPGGMENGVGADNPQSDTGYSGTLSEGEAKVNSASQAVREELI